MSEDFAGSELDAENRDSFDEDDGQHKIADILESDGDDGMGWYVIKVVAGREQSVCGMARGLLKNRMKVDWLRELFVPVEFISRLSKGKQVVVKRVIWPGYMVARMIFSPENRKLIKSVQGVLDFIGGGNAVPLADDDIRNVISLKQRSESGEVSVDPAQFKPGDSVVVRWGDGMGDGNAARVLDVYSNKSGEKVLVEIFAFGREVKMEVDASRVELDVEER